MDDTIPGGTIKSLSDRQAVKTDQSFATLQTLVITGLNKTLSTVVVYRLCNRRFEKSSSVRSKPQGYSRHSSTKIQGAVRRGSEGKESIAWKEDALLKTSDT